MNELDSKAMNFGSQSVNQEEIEKNSIFPEDSTFPDIENHEDLDFDGDVKDNALNRKKNPCGILLQFDGKLPDNIMEIRRGIMHDQIALSRRCKKDEMVWKNRGLPVDLKADKDAFDLRSLNESLPSTAEKKRVVDLNRTTSKLLLGMRPTSFLIKGNSERSAGLQFVTPSYNHIDTFRALHLRAFSPMLDLQKKNLVRTKIITPMRSKQSLKFVETTASSKQKETWKDGLSVNNVGKVPQNSACQDHTTNDSLFDLLTMPRTKDAEMSLDDKPEEKMEEKQNSGHENNEKTVCFVPLIAPQQDLGQLPIWDSGKNWIADFQPPQTSVPLNSPTKKDGGAGQSDAIRCISERCRTDLRQINRIKLNLMRQVGRLETSNSNRGVLSEDKEESEKPSEEQLERLALDAIFSLQKQLKKSEVPLNRQMYFKTNGIHTIKKSTKVIRGFREYMIPRISKCDKVIPD